MRHFGSVLLLIGFAILSIVVLLYFIQQDQDNPEPLAFLKREGALTVEIIPQPTTDPNVNDSVILRFHNIGEKSVYILRPLDGSFEGWFLPFYRLAVIDESGEPVKPRPGCKPAGLWSNTRWPDDYLIELQGGKHFDCPVPLHNYLMKRSGQHTISFEYVYEPEKITTHRGERRTPPPARAWRGTARAAPVVMELRAPPQPRGED